MGEPFVKTNNMTTLLLRPLFQPEEKVDSQPLWYVEDPFNMNKFMAKDGVLLPQKRDVQ